jgi:hypothetical protein
MWTNPQPLNAKISSRPARLAYLIPEHPSGALLDALIAESLSRWGGRRTPLIQTDGKSIAPADWALLDLWDADIIYSYVRLSETLKNRLYSRFAPSEIRTHEGLADHEDTHDLRPDYTGNFSLVSSLSLLPFFARRAQAEGTELPEIVDKERWTDEDSDLDDTFGFVSNSHVGLSLLPYARRLSLRPKQERAQGGRRFNANEVSYVEDAEEFVAIIAKRRSVLTLSRLADMLCPHLHHLARGHEGWDDHLTIVIGDAVDDRLLFWNAQHRYRAVGGTDDLPVLRLSRKRFENGPPDWLKEWIAVRNYRHLDGNQAPRTVLRSCSLPKERLGMVMVSSEHHANPCLFESCKRWTSESREGTLEMAFPSIWAHPRVKRGTRVRFQDNQFEVPLAPPWHVDNFSSSTLSRGVWAVDLTIDRTEDHSRFTHRHHVWKFPRRLRMETAVGFENYVSDGMLVVPPPPRPTENGDLTIWDAADWTRPVLTLPSDYYGFVSTIARLPPGSPQAIRAHESKSSDTRFNSVGVSDKGRDLLGVFQLFGSLPEALVFLTDPFWLEVIDRLSPEEPARKKRNVRELAANLNELVEKDAQGAPDYERVARRALSLAARSFASQPQQLKSASFDQLQGWAIAEQGQDRGNKITQQLIKSVTYLRDRGFLLQGFHWTCSFCQHHNWMPLEGLAAVSSCEICRKSKSSPVAGSLDFRLNPFVHHAFASTSAQGPVIWCMKELAHRATWSFAFAPALNLYRSGRTVPETDLDLVANVDGKVYFVEVKSSFAGVEAKVLNQLKCLGVELRPDVIMLAVKANRPDDGELAKILAELGKELQIYDVRFELLTLDRAGQPEVGGEIALPLAKKMTWSAW